MLSKPITDVPKKRILIPLKRPYEDRSDVKSVVADNEHEPLTTEPRPENTWVLPPYVPEEKPVEEAKPIEETKPVEEEFGRSP